MCLEELQKKDPLNQLWEVISTFPPSTLPDCPILPAEGQGPRALETDFVLDPTVPVQASPQKPQELPRTQSAEGTSGRELVRMSDDGTGTSSSNRIGQLHPTPLFEFGSEDSFLQVLQALERATAGRYPWSESESESESAPAQRKNLANVAHAN